MSYAEHQRHAHAVRKRVRYSILTASDSRTIDTDESGQALERAMREHELLARLVVRDNAFRLRKAVRELLVARPDVLLVNGGTGPGPRDVTVEAIVPLFVKELPGFGERFRALSTDQIGTGAWLSRATAGLLRRGTHVTLAFLLPGSPDACRLAARRLILPELAHAVSVAQGVRPHA